MLEARELYKIQHEYGVAEGSFKDAEITFEEYIAQCRTFISNNLPDEYSSGSWDSEKKQQVLLSLATDFVEAHRVKVKGYVTQDGLVDNDLLLQDVCDAVTGASILKEALEDPEVDEIQINDKNTIFVVRNGVPTYYVDKKGRVMQFANNDEIHIALNRLIDDGTGNMPQFTEGHPLLNAKTAKNQYRVNAVHFVANTQDKPPSNFPITTVVIRKFKETSLTIDDLIRFEAISPKMGRFLMLLGRAELKLFCVGPTGSGKTTLLRIIASTIPKDKRIILIQNPTEITFMERDEYGRNTRNVVHHEVYDKGGATMGNLVSNSLRETPEVLIPGEARDPEEFYQILRAMRTGHKVMGTFHAEDAEDAIGRFASEVSSLGGTTYSEAMRLAADNIDIIISQYKFPNGKRRVMEIAEIEGLEDNFKVKVRKLFEFEMTGEVRIDENGKEDVLGVFKHVGAISERLTKKFYKAAVSRKELEEFMVVGN